jgi:trimeric autotransporter adhesin
MKKIFLLLFVTPYIITAHAQVSGAKTIGVDYPTLNAAIIDLNTVGVGAGGATINVPAGFTETAPANGFVLGSAVLNASLSAANPLIIQKSGSGANPLVSAPVGTSAYVYYPNFSTDAIFILAGGDYITIDAIDLTESAANTTAVTAMEFGYALVNRNIAAPFDGCQNNTIKNCRITLNRQLPTWAACIEASHNTPSNSTARVVTAFGDTHSNNKFYSNHLTNAAIGISLDGSRVPAPYTFYDQNNDIGGNSPATGNSITNLGKADPGNFAVSVSEK